MGGPTPGVALVGGRVTPLPGGPAGRYQGDPGARGRPTSGRPTLLPGHLAQPGAEHSGTRGPTGGHGPTLASPGIWPLKKEPEFQELPHPTNRGNYPSADHFSELIGPLTKVEAAARCGCNMEDFCPGPLAGIDEGDKIRTIYDGSVGE